MTVVDTINKANASCSVTGYTVTYNGSSHTATGACTGVGGVSDVLTGLDLTGTTHTAANTYNDSWTFTDDTANYQTQDHTACGLTLKKKNATVSVTAYTVTYNG